MLENGVIPRRSAAEIYTLVTMEYNNEETADSPEETTKPDEVDYHRQRRPDDHQWRASKERRQEVTRVDRKDVNQVINEALRLAARHGTVTTGIEQPAAEPDDQAERQRPKPTTDMNTLIRRAAQRGQIGGADTSSSAEPPAKQPQPAARGNAGAGTGAEPIARQHDMNQWIRQQWRLSGNQTYTTNFED
jgi:hypothetical protein